MRRARVPSAEPEEPVYRAVTQAPSTALDWAAPEAAAETVVMVEAVAGDVVA